MDAHAVLGCGVTPEQFDHLRERDLVRFMGRIRPVLRASPSGVSFPILRCSWTGRGSTTYTRSEVLRHGEVVGARLREWPTDELRAISLEEHAENAFDRFFVCGHGITDKGRDAVGGAA